METTGIPETSKETFKYPTTYTTPLVPPVTESENKPVLEGDTETWKAIADTYVTISTTGTKDAGTESKMLVKKDDGSKMTRNAYVKFDTTETTLEGVSKATLRLYCTFASSDSAVISQRDVKLYAVSGDWAELTFDWSSQPAILTKVADVDTSGYKSNRWIEIDVTEYVRDHWGEVMNLSLRNTGEKGGNNHVRFNSRNATSNQPMLVVEGYVATEEPVVNG